MIDTITKVVIKLVENKYEITKAITYEQDATNNATTNTNKYIHRGIATKLGV